MSILVIVIHVIVCFALILIVLLQTGKGADMGAAFGGGASQTLFGTTGASTFLSKATTAAAVIFMLTSLVLAYMAGSGGESRLVTEPPAPAQGQTAPEPAPATQPPETKDQAPAQSPQGQPAQESAPATPPAAEETKPSGEPGRTNQ
ncbi:MAG: preprotein translocase subunit SecG [Desulfobacteraceae bacterium]|nr:MAG: preprotein translocase subunit SecG [Desulfobacteraceae bacterium]